MNECLFCRLTNWIVSLNWNFLFPYFLVLFFVLLISFGIGYTVGLKDYDAIWDKWQIEKNCRERLEKELDL